MAVAEHVLIIDDDETFCRFLAETLESAGFVTEWTTDSVNGYELARQQGDVVVLSDVRMPGVSGVELAVMLKQIAPLRKIILISAFPEDALIEMARDLNVPLLAKPFPTQHLLATIEKILAS